MTTDLEQAPPRDVVDPFTGELIPRTDLKSVTLLIRKIRDQEQVFRRIKDWATEAVIEYCDERAEWTVTFGGFKVSVPPPTASDVDWDLDELHKLEDLLPSDRYGELVKQIVVEKPDTRALHNAAKAGGEIAEIITRAERRKPKTRYLRFS